MFRTRHHEWTDLCLRNTNDFQTTNQFGRVNRRGFELVVVVVLHVMALDLKRSHNRRRLSFSGKFLVLELDVLEVHALMIV